MIRVFKHDGTPMYIEKGATVLDFAFWLHKEIGLCARGAMLNHQNSVLPLNTRLSEGDYVVVDTDSDKDNPGNNKRHASIRWFEYLHTDRAIRILSRFLEKTVKTESVPTEVFYIDRDGIKHRYEVPLGATVLDFANIVNSIDICYLKAAYLNKSNEPVDLGRRVMYGDQYMFKVDYTSEPDVKVEWFRYAELEGTREKLVQIFSNKERQKKEGDVSDMRKG